MKRMTYRFVLTLGVAGLIFAAAPNAASARTTGAPVATRTQAGPTFVFPSSGQTFPLTGSMLFQVQPMSGAHGYLWSFVQNGAVVWQNLAWDGRLGGATYSVGKGSRAEGHMHGGAMQVWVRAWMGGAQWSGLSSLGVRLQGAASGPVQPQPVKPQPVQPTHPAPGTTLYYADTSGGLDKWTGSSDWKHVNGMLVNDGNGSTDRWIRAPYQPSDGANYAVEAEIQVVRNCHTFGIIARAKGQGNYAAGAWCENGSAQIWAWSNDATNYNTLVKQTYSTDSDWHTYRFEVRGNSLRLLIDSNLVAETMDNQYLLAGQVGLWSDSTQISVRSFKVIAL